MNATRSKLGPWIGDDVIDLFGRIAFPCDVFQPVAFFTMEANPIPPRRREYLIPPRLDNVRPRFIRDRRGDDVAGRIFDRGRTRVGRKAKHLGRVGFQPLVDAFRREAWKLTQAPLALGEFGENLDPALGNRTVLQPQSAFCEHIVGLLHEVSEGELCSTIPFEDTHNGAGVQHLVERGCLPCDLCSFNRFRQT